LSLPALPLAAGQLGTGSREIALRSWKMTGSSPMMSGVPISWMICAAFVAIALLCPHCRKDLRRTGKKRCCSPTSPPARHVLMILMAVKFFTILYIFMHLKFDKPILTRIFYSGLVLAMLVYLAMLTTFRFWF
jgi:hypothetical protein